MISSLNRVLSASGLVFVLAGFAGTALCADTPPLRPSNQGASPSAAPSVSQPAPSPAPAPASAPAPSADQASAPAGSDQAPQPTEAGGPGFVNPFTPVSSQSLGDVEANLVGVIDAKGGGFNEDMWAGTDRLIVETALPHLPAAVTSPAAMSLARRLLLTRAQSPQGGTHGASFIAERLERVLAIGQVGAIDTMVQQTGDQATTPGISGVAVDALLYQGKDKEACDLAEKQRGIAKSTMWTKRLVFCSALAGKTAEARLGVDVLRDTGDEDEAFAALMGKWLDKSKLTKAIVTEPNAVDFALLRHTLVGLDDDSFERAGVAFDTAWSAYAKAPLPQRLVAAECAVPSGLVTPAALSKLYTQVKVPPGLLAKKKTGPIIFPPGPSSIAYVLQRLAIVKDNDNRGHLIAAALASAQRSGKLSAVSILFRKNIAATKEDAKLIDVAPTLAAGAVVAGDAAQAKRWLNLMKSQGQGDTEAAHALRSLLAVATGDAALQWTADDFLARFNAASGDDRSRAVMEWTLLRALGGSQSDALALAMLDAPSATSGTGPTPAVIDALKAASSHNHLAETVMFSVMALGTEGPGASQVAALQLVVGSLAHVGLTSDARAIAAEALAWNMP
ncbi:MAG: hypothetical protein WAW96_08370 [Alphaproteobacteria bacterium]